MCETFFFLINRSIVWYFPFPDISWIFFKNVQAYIFSHILYMLVHSCESVSLAFNWWSEVVLPKYPELLDIFKIASVWVRRVPPAGWRLKCLLQLPGQSWEPGAEHTSSMWVERIQLPVLSSLLVSMHVSGKLETNPGVLTWVMMGWHPPLAQFTNDSQHFEGRFRADSRSHIPIDKCIYFCLDILAVPCLLLISLWGSMNMWCAWWRPTGLWGSVYLFAPYSSD